MANINNGTVTVQVVGGVGPYQYTLLNAGTNQPIPNNAYPTFQNPVNNIVSNTFTFGNATDNTGNSGLAPGQYKVKIVDSNLCETVSNTLFVTDITPIPPTATPVPVPTATILPTATAIIPTATPVPDPTATVVIPTATPVPDPTATAIPDPTATPVPDPTATEVIPTATPVPDPTATEVIPTATPVPDPTATTIPDPTATPVPDPTATAIPAPTATPVPAPTATAIPDPTATPVPAPTATSAEPSLLGYYFHGGNADYPFGQAAGGLTDPNPGDLYYNDGVSPYAIGDLSTVLTYVINLGGPTGYNVEQFNLISNDIIGLGSASVLAFDTTTADEYYYIAIPRTATDLTSNTPQHLVDSGIATRAVQSANFTLNATEYTLYRLGSVGTAAKSISFSDVD